MYYTYAHHAWIHILRLCLNNSLFRFSRDVWMNEIQMHFKITTYQVKRYQNNYGVLESFSKSNSTIQAQHDVIVEKIVADIRFT